jgi:hypothetical protein
MPMPNLMLAFESQLGQTSSLHIEPFEIVLLAAGAVLTLGMVGFFVFMLTRKEK